MWKIALRGRDLNTQRIFHRRIEGSIDVENYTSLFEAPNPMYLGNELQQFSIDTKNNFSFQPILTVLGKADPGTFFQCKNIEEGNAIIEDGKQQVFFLNIKKDNRFFLFPFFLNIKTTAVSLQQRKKISQVEKHNYSE